MSVIERISPHLRGTLIGALAYGLGFFVGNVVSTRIYNTNLAQSQLTQISLESIVAFLLLVIAVLMITGAFAGLIGGLGLSLIYRSIGRVRLTLASTIGTALGFGLMIFLLILVLALIGFFNSSVELAQRFMPTVTFFGVLFGLVSGLILGLSTVGRRFLWVVLASTVGFGLGGVALGFGLGRFLFGSTFAELEAGGALVLLGWITVFGVLGGGAVGFVYSWLAAKAAQTGPIRVRTKRRWVWVLQIGLFVAVVGLGLFGVSRVVDMLQPKEADHAELISTETEGTHWSGPATLVEPGMVVSEPHLSAGNGGQVAISWVQETGQGSDVWLTRQTEQVNVSNSPATSSTQPQTVVDAENTAHIVWTEAGLDSGMTGILYSQCRAQTCSEPVILSDLPELSCEDGSLIEAAAGHDSATLAIDDANRLMAVWQVEGGPLLYRTWSVGEPLEDGLTGCVRGVGPAAASPRVADLGPGEFALVYDTADEQQSGQIYLSGYTNGNWITGPELMGEGRTAELFAAQDGRLHLAWCGPDDQLRYRQPESEVETISFPGCLDRPGLATDSNGLPHLLWYADQVESATGQRSEHSLLYESIRLEPGWSEPAIVSPTGDPSQVALTADDDETLHLVWTTTDAGAAGLNYASQVQYDCPDRPSTPISRVVLEVAEEGGYRPPAETIPYCHNQYEQFLMSPNPSPPLVAEGAVPTPNGPFDTVAEMVEDAQYEALFAVMFYDAAKNNDSPGFVLAEAIANLYRQLKENPEKYPKGLTVRILLGNAPEPATFEIGNQVWHVVRDLREAGVPEMVNEELGWRVEVADYAGQWPHSHTKFVVVDGKMAAAFGFNYQYIHFPFGHSSGRGNDRVDPGARITGPAAQATQSVFDDMWRGASQRHCSNLNPPFNLWERSCAELVAVPDHVPEVKKYFIPEGNSSVFSLYRSEKYRESDDALARAIESSQETIDIFQINFSLELVCSFTPLLGDFCTVEHAPKYMQALLKAIEENDARARILIYYDGIQALENEVAVRVLEEELAKQGLSDRLEVRYYDDGDMHSKSFLLDDDFVVVGSQNFHYSAWGDGALTEYNFGTDDLGAIDDYREVFDYHWKRAVPRR